MGTIWQKVTLTMRGFSKTRFKKTKNLIESTQGEILFETLITITYNPPTNFQTLQRVLWITSRCSNSSEIDFEHRVSGSNNGHKFEIMRKPFDKSKNLLIQKKMQSMMMYRKSQFRIMLEKIIILKKIILRKVIRLKMLLQIQVIL